MLPQQIAFSGALLRTLLVTALVCSVFAIILEPADTSALPILVAFGLWFTHFLFAAGCFVGGVWGLQKLGCPEPFTVFVSALFSLPVFAAISLVLDYGFGSPDEELAATGSLLRAFPSEIVAVTPIVLAVSLALTFILGRGSKPEAEVRPSTPNPSLQSLIPSVPHTLGDDIVRLHAQDHYVEVATTRGRALLTEQFGDCVERLKDLNGIQCHRSHWICLDHLESLSRTGSAYSCVLSNGDTVPVSRRRYTELRAKIGGSVATKQKGSDT